MSLKVISPLEPQLYTEQLMILSEEKTISLINTSEKTADKLLSLLKSKIGSLLKALEIAFPKKLVFTFLYNNTGILKIINLIQLLHNFIISL